ncbi:MAG: DNA repair protein RadC, partial [Firmicutes bacterium]|nr:DNA repair protein RadC [Bacillota bacterium]
MRDLLRPFLHEPGIDYVTENFTSLCQLSSLTELELLQIPGIGAQKAKKLKDIFALSRALLQPDNENIIIKSPADVYEHFKYMALNEEEQLVALYLNTKNKVLMHTVISKGTLNTSLIHPREVFSAAIRIKCASVIIFHNHPSHCCDPSVEDVDITKRLKEAGTLLGI